jgi:uncharacterized protein (TIGR00661 family)
MALAFTKAGATVDFLFSGRGSDAYFSMEAFGEYQSRCGLTFKSHHGKIDVWQTAKQAQPRQLLKEISELDVSGYDLVMNDFEPVTAWAARQQQVPCLGLSHQNSFRYDVPAAPRSWLDQLLVRYFAPCDQHIGLHWHHFNQPLLPPIVHLNTPVTGQPQSAPPRVLVYLPFEDLMHITALLQALPEQQFVCYHPSQQQQVQLGNVCLKPLSHQQFLQDLHQCQAVISNAGFELPSEAMALGKKILVKPLAGQFEQQSNAATLHQLGLASQMPQLELEIIRQWLAKAPAQPVVYPCVASALVDWILNGHWQQPGSLAGLSKKLWAEVSFPAYVRLN